MARLVPTMLPTITSSPWLRAASAISSASVRPPHLSSLMLIMSKRPTSPAHRRGRARFRRRRSESGSGNLRGRLRARAAAAARAARRRHRRQAFDQRIEIRAREALVGVDAEPHVRPRRANRADPLAIELELAGQLGLDRLRAGIGRARRQPSCSGSSAPSVKVVTSGLGWPTPASWQAVVPASLGLELPHRAIDGVAGAAARHQIEQVAAAAAMLDPVAMPLELGDDMGGVVVEVIDPARPRRGRSPDRRRARRSPCPTFRTRAPRSGTAPSAGASRLGRRG